VVKANVTALAKHYNLDRDVLSLQYKEILPTLKVRAESKLCFKDKNAHSSALHLLHLHSGDKRYSELLMILSVLVTSPMTTADCERGFSVMKLLKTAQRNSLQKNLNACMTIAIEGKEVDNFAYRKAVLCYGQMRKRRVLLK